MPAAVQLSAMEFVPLYGKPALSPPGLADCDPAIRVCRAVCSVADRDLARSGGRGWDGRDRHPGGNTQRSCDQDGQPAPSLPSRSHVEHRSRIDRTGMRVDGQDRLVSLRARGQVVTEMVR